MKPGNAGSGLLSLPSVICSCVSPELEGTSLNAQRTQACGIERLIREGPSEREGSDDCRQHP